jgi:hypothetical protein
MPGVSGSKNVPSFTRSGLVTHPSNSRSYLTDYQVLKTWNLRKHI